MKITMLGLDFNRIMKVCIPALDKVGTRRATEYIEIRCADGIGTATACDGISLAHCQFNYEGDEGCFLLPRHRNVANGALITITIKGNSISVSDGDETITCALCTDVVPNWGAVVLERAAKRRTTSITLSARKLRNIMRSFDSLDDAVTFEIAGDLDAVIMRSSRTYGLLLPIRCNVQRNLAQYIRPLVEEDTKRGAGAMTQNEWDLIYRLTWRQRLRNFLRHWFLAPFGRLRKPRPLMWDKLWEEHDIPYCPHCGRVSRSLKACYFCGQRFTEEV